MPEAGTCPFRRSSARTGVKDMVRISDARMSGTAYGTIVLHVSPESAVGGRRSRSRDGDRIRLSVSDRRLDLLVDDGEPARGADGAASVAAARAVYAKLYMDHVFRPSTAATSTSSEGLSQPSSGRRYFLMICFSSAPTFL